MNPAAARYDPGYLARGTTRQREAFACLQELALFDVLAAHTPAVIGTIPLDIDVKSSDLDISCYARDLGDFEDTVEARLAGKTDFQMKRSTFRRRAAVVTNFLWGSLPVEIFCQSLPVVWQYGYRHWHIESRLLAGAGEETRQELRELREVGWKTEPAFAHYFNLEEDKRPGIVDADSYECLYRLSFLNDSQLWVQIRLPNLPNLPNRL